MVRNGRQHHRTRPPPAGEALTASTGSVAVAAVALGVLARAGAGHRDGPPPAHTGGFGEPTCQACHVGTPLNDPASTLVVDGLDPVYRAGVTYRVTIRMLGDIDTRRAGFQAAFRWAGGAAMGTSAGTLTPLDATVGLSTDSTGRVIYVQHTRQGTEAPQGTREWRFEWTAPRAAGTILLHVAANAANGDDSPLDDLIYTAATRLAPGAGDAARARDPGPPPRARRPSVARSRPDHPGDRAGFHPSRRSGAPRRPAPPSASPRTRPSGASRAR